jgi:hypothetical protein
VESRECPVSLIDRTPLAETLVQIGLDLSTAPAYAPSPLGSASKWPGVFFDAVALMALEDRRIEAAQNEAMNRQ